VLVDVPEPLELAAEVADDVPEDDVPEDDVPEELLAPVVTLELELVPPPSSVGVGVSFSLPPHAATTTPKRTA
jgi:hypothetical protein